jgi:hypothetical protein
LQETYTVGLSNYSLISGNESLDQSSSISKLRSWPKITGDSVRFSPLARSSPSCLLSLQTGSGTFALKQPESKKAFSSQKRISRSTNLDFRNMRLKSRPSMREPGGHIRVFASKGANLNHATTKIYLISEIYFVICSIIPHYRLESASPCSLSNYTSQTYSSV